MDVVRCKPLRAVKRVASSRWGKNVLFRPEIHKSMEESRG